jgi:A/G-specific adenine glycosylase
MQSREVAHALSLRTSRKPNRTTHEVLLEQRPASQTVMPGMWELPALRSSAVPEKDLMMTVRHAIMHVNYYVRVRMVAEDKVKGIAVIGGERRWVPLSDAGEMALTGLARKVLTRAHLLKSEGKNTIARENRRGVA